MTTDVTCRSCGRSIPLGARFCQNCGSDVSLEQAQVALASTTPIPTGGGGIPSSVQAYQDALLERLRAETLGDYEILNVLGRGGMATVYLAHDIALDRKVAIKVMSAAILDEGMSERFRREARTAAALNHPHIIPIYAVRDRYPLLFFAMKFIAGQSLDPILKTSGGLPIPMVQAILTQAGSALGYAHRRGVIHRDIKPANVMIDDEGWVVVTDFGIAKVSSATGLTVTGVTVGTPAYMSPEQCMGKEVTGASDQYSLGVVAYEMLTGQPPFMADSAMALMFAQFQETPKPINEIRPACPPALADIVMRMLEKEPQKRWPSLDDAVMAIGASPLPHDDPTRKQLIQMALNSENARLTQRLSTPTSPIPLARKSGGATTTPIPVAQTPDSRATTVSPPPVSVPPAPLPAASAASVAASAEVPAGTVSRKATRPIETTRETGTRKPWLPWAIGAVVIVAGAGIGLSRSGSEAPETVTPAPAPAESVATGGIPSPPVAAPLPAPDSGKAPSPDSPRATVDRIELNAPRGNLAVGEVRRLTAAARAADGAALTDRAIQWSSSAPQIVVVGSDGTLRALTPGRATITATIEGRSTQVTLTVVPAPTPQAARLPVASVVVSPDAGNLAVGASLNLAALVRDAKGTAVTDRPVVWSTTSSSATVSPGGQVVGVAPGVAIISATSEGRSGSATITVTVTVSTVVLGTMPATLEVGDTVQLTATARDARGTTLSNRPLSWVSSDPTVLSVAAGLAIGRSPGSVSITVTSEGHSATGRIGVTSPQPVAAAPDPAAEKARAIEQIPKRLAAFVQALNSRDMAQLRQAYPGMTSVEEADWAKLLKEKSVTRFEATLEDVQPPRVESGSAESLFQLHMVIGTAGSPAQNQRIRYRAGFEPEGGTWRMMRLVQR